jgi:hypothetical protein
MEEYIIKAHSKSTNTSQRELQLMGTQPSNAITAHQLATSFANRLNEQAANGATDWVGQIELVDVANHARTL